MQNEQSRKYASWRRRVILRRVGLAALALLILTPLVLGSYYYLTNQTVKDTVKVMTSGGLPPSQAFPGRDHINILLLGRDVDINRYKQRLKTFGRSDTIILMRMDFTTNDVRLLSIPRDTAARIPGYRGIHKINAAHALGGPELAMQTVKQLTGVPIDYYVVVNYRALERAIDHMGGVNVYVDKNLDYDDNWGDLHIHLKKGEQYLSGNQAIGFVRFRHSNNGAGDTDFVRMQRQQRLLQALKGELTDPRVLLRVPGALDSVRRDLLTNMTYSQLVSLAFFMKGVPSGNIAMNSLPATMGPVFVYMDEAKARELVEKLFGVPLGGFPVASTPTFEEVQSTSEKLLKHRRALKKSGKPVSDDDLDEISPPERDPAAGEKPIIVNEPPTQVSPESGPAPEPAPAAVEPRPVPKKETVKPAPTAPASTEPAPQPEAPTESAPTQGGSDGTQ